MTASIPYHCTHCLQPEACGYHGLLVFEGDDGRRVAPTCDHHKKPGKPCHTKPVKMVPVHE